MSEQSKTRRPKNPVLAAVLGFFFGPFSTLYFGWRILLLTLVVVFLSTTGLALLLYWGHLRFPLWFPWAVSGFYAIWNPFFAHAVNRAREVGEEDLIDAAAFFGLQGWYLAFSIGTVAVYQGFLLVRESRYLAALAVVFLLAPLAFRLLQLVMVLLLGLLLPIVGLAGLATGAFKNDKTAA